MIDFRPVELQDRAWIVPIVRAGGVRISGVSFGILYGWRDSFGPWAARFGDQLLLHLPAGRGWYFWPVGAGDKTAALDAMRADAAERGRPFRLIQVPEEALGEATAYFGGAADVSLDLGYSDYVYDVDKLIALSGHAYHAKKNHLNRFKAENDWTFEPLSAANLAECRAMAAQWFAENPSEKIERYDNEVAAIHRCLDDYEAMGLEGGLIRTQDGVVAFTMGELLTADTFDSHFEKAHAYINGAYAVINQQMAAYVRQKYPDVKYINREEDMGIPALRQAKLTYRPAFLVDKYTVAPL